MAHVKMYWIYKMYENYWFSCVHTLSYSRWSICWTPSGVLVFLHLLHSMLVQSWATNLPKIRKSQRALILFYVHSEMNNWWIIHLLLSPLESCCWCSFVARYTTGWFFAATCSRPNLYTDSISRRQCALCRDQAYILDRMSDSLRWLLSEAMLPGANSWIRLIFPWCHLWFQC